MSSGALTRSKKFQSRVIPKVEDDQISESDLSDDFSSYSVEDYGHIRFHSTGFSAGGRSGLAKAFKDSHHSIDFDSYDDFDNGIDVYPDNNSENTVIDNKEIDSKKKRKKLAIITILTVALLTVAIGSFLLFSPQRSNHESNKQSTKIQQLPSTKVLKSNDHLDDFLGSMDNVNTRNSNLNTNINKVQSADTISSEDSQKKLDQNLGKRIFHNSNEEKMPNEDYCAKYLNRDIPSNEFPANAWQTDGDYVNNFLDSARQLIKIARTAIYEEYGHDVPENNEAHDIFQMHVFDEIYGSQNNLRGTLGTGGWTTHSSNKNLQKRLLHAMLTNDKFTVVLGGDSNAAGYGNHFLQSYMMQFHAILEPVLQKLGVQLITRNLAHAKLGTLQSSLGSQSIYGDEIDILVWDSQYTDQQPEIVDMFYRQALIGGNRAPALWTTMSTFNSLKHLHEKVGADIMGFGTGMAEIPYTTKNNVQNLPWAVKYMKCHPHDSDLCENHENKYRTNCWVERNDVIPPVQQLKHINIEINPRYDGRYDGFRAHQLTSRVLAVTILNALDQALIGWHKATKLAGHPLPDKHWHISKHYEDIRTKAINLEDGSCFGLDKFIPARICQTPMQARTEYTPRFNPNFTSLTSIVELGLQGPQAKEQNLYDGPDVPNPALELPEGAIDVLSIIKNSRRLDTSLTNMFWSSRHKQNRSLTDRLKSGVTGSSWEVRDSLPGYCDGTSNAICGRSKSSNCLLSGNVDARGGIVGNDTSELLVMHLENIKEGLVIIKIDVLFSIDESHDKIETEDPLSHLPDNFEFEFSIDGTKTIWSKEDLTIHRKVPEKFVELYTLLDDEEMSKSGKTQNLQLALRLHNCGQECAVKLTHVYWA